MPDYCNRANIEDLYGVDNVSKWADLDNDEDSTKIDNRIAASIVAATADIDSKMLGGPYTVPIAKSDSSIPEEIKQVAATLSGVWLYESRGTADYDAENRTAKNRLSFNKDEAVRKLNELMALTRKIDAVTIAVSIPKAHDYHIEAKNRRNT